MYGKVFAPYKRQVAKPTIRPSDHFRQKDTIAVELISNPTPLCYTSIFYTWEKGFKFSDETLAHNDVLENVLGKIMLDKIRRENGDVYTPACIVESYKRPINKMMCAVLYSCNPSQRERVADDVAVILQEMASGNSITTELIASCIAELEKDDRYVTESFEKFDNIVRAELGELVYDENLLQQIKKVTPESLKEHVRQILKHSNRHVGYATTE